jgi:hypothetical protein
MTQRTVAELREVAQRELNAARITGVSDSWTDVSQALLDALAVVDAAFSCNYERGGQATVIEERLDEALTRFHARWPKETP